MPEQLRQAVAEHRRANPPMVPLNRPHRVGDIVTVRGESLTRFALIVKTHELHCQLLLCTNEIDMATDMDAIVHVTPFKLAIFTEMYFAALHDALAKVWGSITPDQAKAVQMSLHTDGESLELAGLETGIAPLGMSPFDARREYRHHIIDELHDLRGPAHAVLLEGWNP